MVLLQRAYPFFVQASLCCITIRGDNVETDSAEHRLVGSHQLRPLVTLAMSSFFIPTKFVWRFGGTQVSIIIHAFRR